MVQPEAPAPDFGRLAAEAQAATKPEALERLGADLGLSVDSLQRLGASWLSDRRAWGFPMRDAGGRILGVRLRLPSGRKLSIKGGREGLFVPSGLQTGGRLLICEGPTDAATLLDLGFSAVGRPSCNGGVRHIVDLVRRLAPSEAVIVADADRPGQLGADRLASKLAAYVPTLRVVQPPEGIKDARAWKAAGATPGDVTARIEAAELRRLSIQTRKA
jgi:DNA primase